MEAIWHRWGINLGLLIRNTDDRSRRDIGDRWCNVNFTHVAWTIPRAPRMSPVAVPAMMPWTIIPIIAIMVIEIWFGLGA